MTLRFFTAITSAILVLLTIIALVNDFTILGLFICLVALLIFAVNYVKKFRDWFATRIK